MSLNWETTLQFAKECSPVVVAAIPCTGAEHPAQTSGKTPVSERGGAECGAQRAPRGQFEPDLQRVIDGWPTLPDALKTGILAMITAASGDRGEA